MAPITTYLLHNSKSIAGTYLGGRGNLATEYHHHHQHSNHRSMRLHVEKHRVIMIHLMVGGILVMILMIHMRGKEAQIFYILGTFLISFMYTMSNASVLPPNSGR